MFHFGALCLRWALLRVNATHTSSHPYYSLIFAVRVFYYFSTFSSRQSRFGSTSRQGICAFCRCADIIKQTRRCGVFARCFTLVRCDYVPSVLPYIIRLDWERVHLLTASLLSFDCALARASGVPIIRIITHLMCNLIMPTYYGLASG